MRARAPASSANLGPGFDTLAVALDCYVSVEVEPALSLRVHSEGEGSGLFDDASHLAARVAVEVLGHDRVAVTVRSQIPVARGLGSSAALAAAAAAAAGAEDPFAVAAAHDGHPENAAATVFGGLVAATTVEGTAVHAPLPLADELAFVAVVPERNLATPAARQALPETISRADAVFNLGRMGLLLAGLADPAYLVAGATADRIHQPARTAMFPEAPALLRSLVDAGALAASWSGAGPTLIGMVDVGSVEVVRSGAEAALGASGVPGRVLSLRADRRGIVYGDEAEVRL
ncbi:MAG: homoserine kinase [Acidimicrobiales bacterium]